MYLIDTSVWIDFLKKNKNPAVQYLHKIIDNNLSLGITSVVYQEVLQGAATKKDFDEIDYFLKPERFYHPKDSLYSYRAAAEIYFTCRKQGFTIRSTIDCLIAQIAIENKLVLLHNDKDYEIICQVTELKTVKLSGNFT